MQHINKQKEDEFKTKDCNYYGNKTHYILKYTLLSRISNIDKQWVKLTVKIQTQYVFNRQEIKIAVFTNKILGKISFFANLDCLYFHVVIYNVN